jgi:hypothetical protein
LTIVSAVTLLFSSCCKIEACIYKNHQDFYSVEVDLEGGHQYRTARNTLRDTPITNWGSETRSGSGGGGKMKQLPTVGLKKEGVQKLIVKLPTPPWKDKS